MKILLLALPRSGTKFAQVNLNFYLTKKYGITLNNPESPSTKYIGYGELLNVTIALKNHHLTLENNRLGKIDKTFDNDEEFESRFKISQCGIPVVAKYMPTVHTVEKEIEIVTRLINSFDKVYIFNRINVYDHILSIAISQKLNSWNKSSVQDQLIKSSIENKIVVHNTELDRLKKSIDTFNEIINQSRNEKCVDIMFEELIKVKDKLSFCNLFHIEYEDFFFYDNFEEYSHNKSSMTQIIE